MYHTFDTVTLGQTGVEMEALTAVSVALLTVYDMCKAVTQEMVISEVKLLSKSGGRTEYHATKVTDSEPNCDTESEQK